MDTPAIPAPRDAREQAILARLSIVRDQLLLLKQDRTTYIRSQDVIPLYNQTIEQVKELNDVRAENGTQEENRCAPSPAVLFCCRKQLLTKAALYSAKDLESIKSTLEETAKAISEAQKTEESKAKHSPYLLTLLAKRVALCQTMLNNLRRRLEGIGAPLLAIHENEVQKLRNQLLEVGEKRKDGKFLCEDGTVPTGEADISELYERCVMWSDLVLERKGNVAEQWRPTYDILVGIRNDLEKLSLTQAWSLRETDLYDFQRQLDKIDESRQNGNFYDDRGRPADLWTQRTMLYLIRRSYAYIYSFMLSSEPVSEALLPIYNQLQTLKRCLIEVKKNGGVTSVRELYPYSMKLNSLDNMRVDGKFVVNGDVPEGQGSVSELLAECFDLNYELRVAAEEGVNGDEVST
ncbi:putative protein family UPF0662 [Moelleriella libera RCEF 2490]|uniref:Uncharacterized protein n=1 Tax=Moelleriella libera RCEF 2490 TaxID=1081109 RepID=A0A166V5R1_9HYPO|nr:putative protein family UPF0662 [Moelleriella libera RCEF 2490]